GQTYVGSLHREAGIEHGDTFVNNWNDHNLTNMMEEGGVHIIRGHRRLDERKRVTITASDGTKLTLLARHAVVLPPGSSPAIPDIPGLAQVNPWTSRSATSSKKVPQRLAIMGDGAVACEMA